MKTYNIVLYTLLFFVSSQVSAVLPDPTQQVADTKIFTTVVEDKQKKIESLKEKNNELQEKNVAFLREIKSSAQEVKSSIVVVKGELTQNPQNEFANRQLALLNERDQVLKEKPLVWEKIITQVDNHIRYLTEYLEDPDFKKYKNDLLKDTTAYSFEYFQQVHQWMVDQEKKLRILKKNLKIPLLGLKVVSVRLLQRLKRMKKRQKSLDKREKGLFQVHLFLMHSNERVYGSWNKSCFKIKSRLMN